MNRLPQGPASSPPGNRSSAHLQRSTFTHDATPFLVPIPAYHAPGVVIGAADCVAGGGDNGGGGLTCGDGGSNGGGGGGCGGDGEGGGCGGGS